MTFVRVSRWIILLGAFIASVSWSYVAINHLLGASLNQEQRVSQYSSTALPQGAFVQQMQASQMHWGRQSLFSVACSFFMLLVVLMNWVLDGPNTKGDAEVVKCPSRL